MNSIIVRCCFAASMALALSAVSAAGVEQNCRFIQAKPDREACYKRREDDAVYRSINNICRGC